MKGWQKWILGIAGTTLVLAICVGIYVDTDEPGMKDPGFLDSIVNNRLALAFARIGLVAVVVYLVISLYRSGTEGSMALEGWAVRR